MDQQSCPKKERMLLLHRDRWHGTCWQILLLCVHSNQGLGSASSLFSFRVAHVPKSFVPLQADLWSVGIILYELLIGQTPFDGGNHIQLLRNIERHEVHIPLAERSKLSPHSINLIFQLLKRNPIERISFEVSCILQYRYFCLWQTREASCKRLSQCYDLSWLSFDAC